MKKTKNTSLAKTTADQIKFAKAFVTNHLQFLEKDPDALFQEAFSLLKACQSSQNEECRKEAQEDLKKMAKKLSRTLSLDTNYLPLQVIDERLRSFALQMIKDLHMEFVITTASEKSLVQTAVISFCQFLTHSQALNDYKRPEWISHEKAQFLSFYGKQADKAFRRYLSALQTLKQVKTQPIKVNITAKTAFMAENQQINNSSTHENIKA